MRGINGKPYLIGFEGKELRKGFGDVRRVDDTHERAQVITDEKGENNNPHAENERP